MRELTRKTWKIADIGTFLKNSGIAILKGQFLLRLNVGRYFVHIIYTFILFAAVIWISLMIDNTMAKVEKGKKELEELSIAHSQKTYELVRLTRRSTVQKTLENLGSAVTEPGQPATRLE